VASFPRALETAPYFSPALAAWVPCVLAWDKETGELVLKHLDKRHRGGLSHRRIGFHNMKRVFAWLGPRKSGRIRLAVMDMWKPFRTATARHAPQASILFDKFHVLRHLGEALDKVRKSEYARLSGTDQRFITTRCRSSSGAPTGCATTSTCA